jgi:hypothetical protein
MKIEITEMSFGRFAIATVGKEVNVSEKLEAELGKEGNKEAVELVKAGLVQELQRVPFSKVEKLFWYGEKRPEKTADGQKWGRGHIPFSAANAELVGGCLIAQGYEVGAITEKVRDESGPAWKRDVKAILSLAENKIVPFTDKTIVEGAIKGILAHAGVTVEEARAAGFAV